MGMGSVNLGTGRWAVLHTALGRVGGAERQLVRFVSAARSNGHMIDIFYGGPVVTGLSELGNLYQDSVPRNPVTVLRSYLKVLSQLRHYDVILVYHHVDPLLLLLTSSMHGEKCIAYIGEPLRPLWEEYVSGEASLVSPESMRSSVTQLWGKHARFVLEHQGILRALRWFLRRLDRLSFRRIGRHVANSQFIAQAVQEVYGLRISPPVVYQGIPYQPSQPPRKTSRALILNVGAFLPMKEQATLLKAWAKVQDLPVMQDHAIMMVGDGPLLGRCQDLAQTLHLKRVHFVQSATDEALLEFYERAAILVHCAIAEPFGMTPVEAAAHHVPSIVTDLGGAAEFVVNQESGWVFPPRDVDRLAALLIEALTNQEQREVFGQNAFRRLQTYFSIDQNVRGLLAQALPENQLGVQST